MSSVIAPPELITTAATNLANIGASLSAANSAATGPTTVVTAAAKDEVSAAIASLFFWPRHPLLGPGRPSGGV
jgi:hypothetical protein